ncbi:MAG: hypothetical protein ACFFG0_36330 [Candidatus Thorarchaeota archaeon]
MREKNFKNGEIVEYVYSVKDGNYIEKIFHEFETDKAVKFGRNIDDKIIWIPKSLIKGGWKKDKKLPQNIKVKFPAQLYWNEPNKIYSEM